METAPSLRFLAQLLSLRTRPCALILVLCFAPAFAGCGNGTYGTGNGGGGGTGTPALTANVVAPGNFSSGEQNATYTIQVNNTGTGATSGTTTVNDPPTGFTITAMAGTNWSCTVATGVCTSSQTVAGGSAFPPITVTGNVTAANGTPVSIPLSVSGGGVTTPVTSTPTVTVAAASLGISKSHTGNFNPNQQGATYTVTVKDAPAAGATNGKVTVTETVPPGETLVSMSGTGWTCPGTGGATTCDRSDVLTSGSSYPAITVTVNVAVNATSPQTNQVTVAGGGMTGSASTTDPTTIGAEPDLSMSLSHTGNFGAGQDGIFTLAVSNGGNGPTAGTITVTDTLPAAFTFVSGTASGWTCGAAAQVVTCTNPGPVAQGTTATNIPLVVAVNANALGVVANTASVSTAGDANPGNNSATDNVNVLATASFPESILVTVPGAGAGGVIYAGGNAETVAITVTNQGAGDVLTPTLTLSGAACTAATCGTVVPVSATAATYTPPPSLAAATNVTLTVSSSSAGSFPATVTFTVFPGGTTVAKITGIAGGIGVKNLTAFVFNDPGTPGHDGVTASLLGAGYACPLTTGGATVCGTLAAAAPMTGTTVAAAGTTGISFTSTVLTYTLPASEPNSPYDRPMIFAVSKADPTAVAQVNFPLLPGPGTTQAVTGPIGITSRLDTILTGGPTQTLIAGFGAVAGPGVDTSVNKTAVWTITANGANCQPACGSLSNPTYTWNGGSFTSFISYTPPATLPAGAAANPVITVSSVDAINGIQFSDTAFPHINDGTCGSGNNSILNGQYAFLLQGGGESIGYAAFVGSITADGNGHITAGALDVNRTTGATPSVTVTPAASSYSVGPDNRGCLTLAFSTGALNTYRFALGSLVSNVATQGQIVRYDDDTGAGTHAQGVLVKQSTPFVPINGSFAFGYQGITSAGNRLAVAGVETANGAGGVLSNFDIDAMDGAGNNDPNDKVGSGTYTTVDANGRGTGTLTNSQNVTSNFVFYLIDSSHVLSMSTSPLTIVDSIVSGEAIQQTVPGGGFAQTSLDGNSYVFYETGVDPTNGESVTAVAQAAFTTSGADTTELNVNDAGAVTTGQTNPDVLTISANGRATNANNSLVFYLIDTHSAFLVTGPKDANTANAAGFGFGQQQTPSNGPFTNSSLSGQFFLGIGVPVSGGDFLTGTGIFDGVGTLAVKIDDQGPEGGESPGAANFSYTVSPAFTGKVVMPQTANNPGLIGYAVSDSRVILMTTDTSSPTSPELIIGQK